MNRNIILYVLIALLVVVGGTWYALSTRSIDNGVKDELTEEEQDADVDDEEGESENEDADGGSASNGGATTGTSASVNGGTSDGFTINGGSASVGSNGSGSEASGGSGTVYTGVGGTESFSLQKQRIAIELGLQLEIVESIITIIQLQLESGDLSVDDASDLLGDMAHVLEILEDTVGAYLAL